MKDRGLVPVEGFDTAGSAKMLSDGELTQNAGAIASRRAVDLYGLKLGEADIEDDEHNFTRFLILSLEKAPKSVAGLDYKTSLAITLENKAGALCKALGIFSALDLFMTKIESRHLRSFRGPSTAGKDGEGDKIWEYVFYIDIAADYNDPKTQTAFTLLQQITYVLPHTYLHRSYRWLSSPQKSTDSRFPFSNYLPLILPRLLCKRARPYFRVLGSYPTHGR